MALLDILCYPDPRLHTVAQPVHAVDDTLRAFIADMFETMYHAKGVGLAAPQIGKSIRLFIVDGSPFADEEDDEENEAMGGGKY